MEGFRVFVVGFGGTEKGPNVPRSRNNWALGSFQLLDESILL